MCAIDENRRYTFPYLSLFKNFMNSIFKRYKIALGNTSNIIKIDGNVSSISQLLFKRKAIQNMCKLVYV